MPRSSPVRVRFALAGVFAALALGFVISPGHAQYGRPPGGITGRPPPLIPPRPGGITGIHGGGISGMPSGITGGGITGIHGGGIGGMPGMGFGRNEWRCSGCNCLIGTGIKPIAISCPQCGARFSNGITPEGFDPPRPPAPPVRPPSAQPNTGATNTPPPAPALPTNPAFGANGAVATSTPAPNDTPQASAAPAPTNPSTPEAGAAPNTPSSGGRSKTYAVIGIVVGALLLVGALVALGIVVTSHAAKPVKRKVKRRVLDDDE